MGEFRAVPADTHARARDLGALSVSGGSADDAQIVADAPVARAQRNADRARDVRGRADRALHDRALQRSPGALRRSSPPARAATGSSPGYLRAVKEEEPNTLVLDAGDDYEKGSIADLRSMGEATRRMIQALPIDVRTIGNHDFAYGESAVLRDVTLSAHPVLAANVHYARRSHAVRPVRRGEVGCVRVGRHRARRGTLRLRRSTGRRRLRRRLRARRSLRTPLARASRGAPRARST